MSSRVSFGKIAMRLEPNVILNGWRGYFEEYPIHQVQIISYVER